MRSPSHTKQALTEPLSGRGALITVGAIAIACVLAAVWLLFGRPSSSTASLEAPSGELLVVRALPIAAESERSTRASAEIAEPGEVYVVPPETQPSIPPDRFSGHFVFEDGSIPPEMNFRFEAFPPATTAVEGCAFEARGRTEAQGAFVVDGLCHGGYVITPDISGLPRVQGVYNAPAADMQVVLGGYLIHARIVGRDGLPRPGSDVFLTYAQRPNDGRPERTSRLERRSDEAGESWIGLPENGSCTLSASSAEEHSREHEIRLDGQSRIVEVALVLDEPVPRASLRVELRNCAEPRELVQSFCIDLVDPKTGSRVRRLCAEEAPDPVFANLRSGTCRVCPVDRVVGPPVYYRSMEPAEGPLVELVEGRESTVQICVRLGGRLAVIVRDADNERKRWAATVEVEPIEKGGVSKLNFRSPWENKQSHRQADSGVSVDGILYFVDERTSDEVLDAGTYTVTARSERYEPASQVVDVRAGETTRVTLLLRRR